MIDVEVIAPNLPQDPGSLANLREMMPPVSPSWWPPAPDWFGLAVHEDRPVVEDRTARGAFTGIRTERTTFVCEAPGRVEVPEVVIRWFDLDVGAMAAATVEGLAWSVAPAPASTGDAISSAPPSHAAWWIAAIAAALGGAGIVLRRRIVTAWAAWRTHRAESEPAYFRRALAACRANDPAAALRDLLRWLDRATSGSRTPRLRDLIGGVSDGAPELEPILAELELRAFDGSPWDGRALAASLRRARAARAARSRDVAPLPPLNPE